MTVYYSNDFDADTPGTLPAGFQDFVTGGGFQVGVVNPISFPNSFGDTAPVNLDRCLLTLGSPQADMDVVFTFKAVTPGSGNYNFSGPILRSDGSNTSDYFFAMNTTQLGAFYKNGGGFTQIGSFVAAFPFVNGVRYSLRAQVQGTNLRIRFWRYGVQEPSAWYFTTTDGNVTAAGGAGVHVTCGGTNPESTVDDFRVGSNNFAFPIPAAPQVGPIFEPPLEWLEVSAVTGKVDGDPVPYTDLLDQSGAQNNPTAGVSGTYRTGVIGSKAGIELNGTTQNYVGADVIPLNANYSIALLVVPTDVSAISYLSGGDALGNGHSLYLNSSVTPRLYQGADVLLSSRPVVQGSPAAIIATISDTVCAFEEDATRCIVVNGRWGGTSGYSTIADLNDTDQTNGIGIQGSTVGSRFKFVERLVYAAPLSGGEINQINSYWSMKYGLSLPQFARSVIFDGDSFTTGAITTDGLSYVERLGNALASTVCLRFAARGRLLSELVSSGPANIPPRLSLFIRQNVIFVWAGVNDNAAGASAATMYANLVQYCQDRRAEALALGITIRIVVVKMTPSPANETRRVAFNASIDGNGLADWDAVAGSTAALWAPGANSDTTYYDVDGIHWNDAGHGLGAQEYQEVIEGLDFPTAADPTSFFFSNAGG